MQQSTRIAILALIELASDPDRQVSVSEIGQKFRVSAHHLAKVMNTLGRAGLVKSTRGVGGGYSFSGNARRTTLLDVIELFEDTAPSCKLADPSQATAPEWALYDVSREIKEMANATYGSITLATMVKQLARYRDLPARAADAAAVS
ncbi:MAG: hypothetical protein Kow0058_12270 [Roseovarius sp.]